MSGSTYYWDFPPVCAFLLNVNFKKISKLILIYLAKLPTSLSASFSFSDHTHHNMR